MKIHQSTISRIQFRTHAYARRQITWFRKDKKIKWNNDPKKIEILAKKWYNNLCNEHNMTNPNTPGRGEGEPMKEHQYTPDGLPVVHRKTLEALMAERTRDMREALGSPTPEVAPRLMLQGKLQEVQQENPEIAAFLSVLLISGDLKSVRVALDVYFALKKQASSNKMQD